MNVVEWQTRQFEQHRAHLRAVAGRMLGSSAEADDAVQEAWLRLNRADASELENVRAWLTTVVGRICLDMLRARQARREELVEGWPHELNVPPLDQADPEQEALLADSVGLALIVVLDTLSPAERLAFVLHGRGDGPAGRSRPAPPAETVISAATRSRSPGRRFPARRSRAWRPARSKR